MFYALCIILLFQLFFYYQIRNKNILSSVNIFVLFYLIVLVSSTVYIFFIPKKLFFNWFRLDFNNTKKYLFTAEVFVKMLIMFLAGVFTIILIRPFKNENSSQSLQNKFSLQFKENQVLLPTLIVFFISILLVFLDWGTDLFHRTYYIKFDSFLLRIIYSLLFLFLSLLLGLLYSKKSFLSISLLIITLIVNLAIGTRYATVYLLVFFVIRYLIEQKKTKYLLYRLPFVLFFYSFNLGFRQTSTGKYGLIPFTQNIIQKPYLIFDSLFVNIYYTFIFGFYATYKTISKYADAHFSYFIISVNPLPGKWSGWYDISDKLRLYKHAPFTTIGELYQYSFMFYIYFYILGIYFVIVDQQILKNNNRKILTFCLFGLSALFTIFSFEYNLRASNRFLVYSLILLVIMFFMKKMKKIRLHEK